MTEKKQDQTTAPRHESEIEKLPYRVELWAAEDNAMERVLGRALNAALARSIFKAALTEYPNRRVTLSRGGRIITNSSQP